MKPFILEPQEVEELRRRLVDRLETVVPAILGEPKIRGNREWRFGSNGGSLRVVIAGDKRGLWHDSAPESGGDLLALIATKMPGGNFPAVLERACHLVGYSAPSHDKHLTNEQRRARAAMAARDRAKLARDLAERKAEAEARTRETDAARIAVARQMLREAVPPQGTPAEPYITVTRGTPLDRWPRGLGWHPGERALIAMGTTVCGIVTCAQIVRLTDAGEKRLNGALVKQTFGRLVTERGRSALRLPTREGVDRAILCHAEGIETALSGWAATGYETWAALGSGLDPQPDRVNVVCRDDDAPGSDRAVAFEKAALAWSDAGIGFVVATPWETPRGDRSDFNDLIRSHGAEAVKARIDLALASRRPTVPLTVPMPPIPQNITTDRLRDVVGLPIVAWFQQATVQADERVAKQKLAAQRKNNDAYQPNIPEGQQALAMSGVGSGKTDWALKGIDETLSTPVPAGHPARRVIVQVQDHTLAEDLIRRSHNLVRAEHQRQIHLGYNQPDPNAEGFADKAVPVEQKIKQCLRAKEMDEISKAGGGMSLLCGSQECGFCEFNAANPDVETACGYTTTPTIESGLIVLAGPETLKQGAPGSFKRQINYFNSETRRTNKLTVDVADVVVIDEPKTIALIGPAKADDEAYVLNIGELTVPLTMFGNPPDNMTAEEVQHSSETVSSSLLRLDGFLATLNSGPLAHNACLKILAMTNWMDVRRRAFQFKAELEDYIKPSMRGDALTAALARVSRHNGGILRIERLCRSLVEAASAISSHPEDALSGQIELRHIPAHGEKPPARVLALRWIVPVHKAWAGPPTLQLDAEAKPEVMRRWWPKLEVLTDARLPDGAVYRRQVYNCAFPYMSYAPKDPSSPPGIGERATDKQENTCWNNCRWLLRFITDKLNKYRNEATGEYDVLVIAPLRVEQALRALWEQLGGLPSRLGLIHFQNFAGVNEYANVRYLCMIGRPQPRTEIFEAMAWTINGVRGTSIEEDRLPPVDGAYLMRDGTARAAKVRQHPDEMAELIRTILVTNQLIQGEGRGRAIWRTPDNPLFVDHLCDIPLPLLIDELVTLEDVKQEAATARWLLASGLCVSPEERGCLPFLAAITGRSLNAIEVHVRARPGWLASFRHPTTMPIFNVKVAGERYAIPVGIDADSIEEAQARLVAVGIKDAKIERPARPPKDMQSVADKMAARGLILFSPTHALVWYDEIFRRRNGETGNVESAKKSMQRAGLVAPEFRDISGLKLVDLHSKIESLLRRSTNLSDQMSRNWVGVSYRVAGVGQQGCFAVVDASRLDIIRAEMETKLGPMEVFELIAAAPEPMTLVFPPTLIPTRKRPPWYPPTTPHVPPRQPTLQATAQPP